MTPRSSTCRPPRHRREDARDRAHAAPSRSSRPTPRAGARPARRSGPASAHGRVAVQPPAPAEGRPSRPRPAPPARVFIPRSRPPASPSRGRCRSLEPGVQSERPRASRPRRSVIQTYYHRAQNLRNGQSRTVTSWRRRGFRRVTVSLPSWRTALLLAPVLRSRAAGRRAPPNSRRHQVHMRYREAYALSLAEAADSLVEMPPVDATAQQAKPKTHGTATFSAQGFPVS